MLEIYSDLINHVARNREVIMIIIDRYGRVDVGIDLSCFVQDYWLKLSDCSQSQRHIRLLPL